jgi:cyanate permease
MSAPASRYRFVVEALLFLTYAVFGLSWIGFTPLLPDLQAAYGLSQAQLGLLNTLVSVAKVITPLLTGWLALRLGMRATILLGSLLISVATLVPFAPHVAWILAERFVFGIGGAMVVTLFSPMVMQWFPAHERPLVTAINNVAVNTGIAITLFTTVPLATRIGWRQTLFLYGALSVILCLAWAFLGRERQQAATMTTSTETVGYRQVWAKRETWFLAMGFTGPLALYLALNTWLPAHLMATFSMTKAAAASFTGLFNLVGIPAALISGELTRRTGVRRPFIIGSGLLMSASATAMVLAPSATLRTCGAIGLGIALFTYVAPLFTIPMELPESSPQTVSLTMATVLSTAYAVSSVSPLVVGWLQERTGSYATGLVFWAIGSLVLTLAGVLLPETGPRSEARQQTAEALDMAPAR